MSIRRVLSVLVLAVVAVAACGGDDDTATSAPAAATPTGTWEMVAGTFQGEEIPVVEGSPVTLTIEAEEQRLSGTSACNNYFTSGTIVDGVVTVEEAVGSTMMMCNEEGVMEAEQLYQAALPTVTTAEMDGETLVLTGPEARLEFVATQ